MSHPSKIEICNWDNMPIQVEVDKLKTNWLPICVSGVQYYVSEISDVNNTTGAEGLITKLYKQGANGAITTSAPIGAIVEGYCNGFHTEVLCDVVNATFSGTLNPTIAGTTYSINTGTITLTNDLLINYLVDWGNGFTDIGLVLSYDFVNQPPSKYEPKLYGITDTGQIIFITAIEINWNGTTLTNITSFPITINRQYRRISGRAFQNFNGSTPIGTPYTNGGTYSPVGTLTPTCPEFRNDYLGIADVTNNITGGSAGLLPLSSHTVSSGTDNIPVGSESVTIKKTNAAGTVSVNGYNLTALNETITLTANDFDSASQRWQLPAITVTNAAGGTHQWIRIV